MVIEKFAVNKEFDVFRNALVLQVFYDAIGLLFKNIADFFSVNEKELLEEFLSDQIAYKILDEEVDLNILKVAEEKVTYMKTLRNSSNNKYNSIQTITAN